MKPINIGIIGLGYWGKNYVRIVDELAQVELTWCCDIAGRTDSGNSKFVTDYKSSLDHLNAVIVATPASTHYTIVKDCLIAGKDVLVEKPITLNTREAEELVAIAKKTNRILMVGHTFLYNPAVLKLKEYIDTNYLGDIFYLYLTRTGLGPIRKDVNVVWDLASHDISMLLYLLGTTPMSVCAMGQSYLQKAVEDVVFASLRFPDNILGAIHVSWLGPYKIRQVTVVGSKRMVVFDDVNKLEPLKIFDKGVDLKSEDRYVDQFQVRDGDINIPKLDMREPLKSQTIHFLECVKERKEPLTNGKEGLEVVKVMEEIDKCLM